MCVSITGLRSCYSVMIGSTLCALVPVLSVDESLGSVSVQQQLETGDGQQLILVISQGKHCKHWISGQVAGTTWVTALPGTSGCLTGGLLADVRVVRSHPVSRCCVTAY